MVFLLLSVKYPTKKQRQDYLREAGPHATFTSPTHKPLAVSANEKQWKYILKMMLRHMTTTTTTNESDRILRSTPLTMLNDKSKLRPLRPDDDNYKLFVAPKWMPECAMHIKTNPLHQLLDIDHEIIPYYDHCAYCTKPQASHQCSRCKFVRYCSRDCQAQAWRGGPMTIIGTMCSTTTTKKKTTNEYYPHKKSCVKAQRYSLHEAMHGNDGFYITSEECQLIANSLQLVVAAAATTTATTAAITDAARYNNSNSNSVTNNDDADLLRCFRVYFESVQALDGCFML